MKLTIYHNGQFWIGILEQVDDRSLKAVQHIFGSEPKGSEILEFVNSMALALLESQKTCIDVDLKVKKVNPKRLQRQVAKESLQIGIGTYAEQAIQKELETKKKERQVTDKERRKQLAEYKRELAAQKKKSKHKGR